MNDVLVLCYHAVSPTWPARLSVTPDALERQMRWLVANGWHACTFRDAVREPRTARTVAITFDDAYASVAQFAYPILASLGLRATVFAPTDYVVDGGRVRWAGIEHWASTPHAYELDVMSWDTLGALADRGWEVGSHTRTHPRLTQLDDAALRAELEGSREACNAGLDLRCETIAYPYGDVDERVATFARCAGYLAGATLSRRLEYLGPYRWPRLGIYRDDRWWRFWLKMNPAMRRVRRSSRWPDAVAKPRQM